MKIIEVETANDMKNAVIRNCVKADYIFMAAAVADYMPNELPSNKIKRTNQDLILNLKPTPDILKSLNGRTKAIITAFALETSNGEKEAIRKMKEKNANFIVLNYANEKGVGFDSSTNRVIIFSKDGLHIELKKDLKDRIAKKIIQCILNN